MRSPSQPLLVKTAVKKHAFSSKSKPLAFYFTSFFGAKSAFSTILPFYLVKDARIFTALKTAFSSQKVVFKALFHPSKE